MSAVHSTKWFWTDWRGDEAVRRLTPAERGVWIDMLALAAAGIPTGYVTDAKGRELSLEEIGRFTNCPDLDELAKLIGAIEEKGAASRDRAGRLFNRRMVRDTALSAKRSLAGKEGANALKRKRDPVLLRQNNTELDKEKNLSSNSEVGKGKGARARKPTRLPTDWKPSQADIDYAVSKGMARDRIPTAAEKFKFYWLNRHGKDGLKLDWHLCWCTWVMNDLEWKGGRNGSQAGSHHPAGPYGASKDKFRDAHAELKAFLAEDGGDDGQPSLGLLPST